MKNVVGRLLLALAFFAAGAACWREAQLTRRLADAHQRLATLHYDEDDGIDSAMSAWNRLPWTSMSHGEEIRHHRATVSYWLTNYDSFADVSAAAGTPASDDPQLLFVAANASFRSSAPETVDRKAAIDRLDTVTQAYASVLRKDPALSDAAFNYEFVVRYRDGLAKSQAMRKGAAKPAAKPVDVSIDLPVGVTVHGRPGGPPTGTDMSEFKTLTPLRIDERKDEQNDQGRGRETPRKG